MVNRSELKLNVKSKHGQNLAHHTQRLYFNRGKDRGRHITTSVLVLTVLGSKFLAPPGPSTVKTVTVTKT
jgi:hypothetical protein